MLSIFLRLAARRNCSPVLLYEGLTLHVFVTLTLSFQYSFSNQATRQDNFKSGLICLKMKSVFIQFQLIFWPELCFYSQENVLKGIKPESILIVAELHA